MTREYGGVLELAESRLEAALHRFVVPDNPHAPGWRQIGLPRELNLALVCPQDVIEGVQALESSKLLP